MHISSRKEFLQTSGLFLAAAMTGASFDFKKENLRLSFSTLGCPDWTFEQITDFAAKHHYKGIEIRGLLREMDLTRCEIFSKQNLPATIQLMKDKDIQFVNLGSSASMHFPYGSEREKQLDDAKRFIDLARQISCPFIRVFPNNFLKDRERNETIDLIINGLLTLGDYAKGSSVRVLLETHGDLVKTEDLEKIISSADHPHTGLVWDLTNMWAVTKESPASMYKNLKKYIYHTHIKDARFLNDKIRYTLIGKGEVPVVEAIRILAKDGYKGFYSFEWEKLWHPELEEPEIALADYPVTMKKHFEMN